MIKKHHIGLCFIFVITFVLVGCGKGKVLYQNEFPNEISPGLSEFMQNQFNKIEDNLIINENGNRIYADGRGGHQNREIIYHERSEKQLEQYYSPLLNSENSKRTLNELKKNIDQESSLRDPIKENHEYSDSLPYIKVENNNRLILKLGDNEKIINLPDMMLGIKKSDELIYNLIALNDYGFVLSIRNFDTKENYYAFVVNDFSSIDIYHSEDLDKLIKEEVMTKYYSLLPSVGKTGAYSEAFNGSIIVIGDNEVINVEEDDYRSEDRGYIYINGARGKLLDGVQQIQTIENYIDGNDIYESEFKISFKKIAKKAGLKTSGVSIAKIVYFNEDYVVLALNYKAFIVGDAGYTNVIIDLQKDKNNPTVYVVDLGIH